MTTRKLKKKSGTRKKRGGNGKLSKKHFSKKLDDFSHLFVTYINQIFGDRSVRTLIYELFGNKSHNKHLRFGLVAFHRYEDPSDEWVEANKKRSVPKEEASYYDNETDIDIEDSDNNHHVLYDMKNKRYIDSVNTEGMKYQDQERDENDSLCQSYTLMFFFDFELSKDPIQKQMEIIGMYDWLLKQEKFKNKLESEFFFEKVQSEEHWIDEDGYILPTQNTIDFNLLIDHIETTLKLWEDYGYWNFIGKGDQKDIDYDIKDYHLGKK